MKKLSRIIMCGCLTVFTSGCLQAAEALSDELSEDLIYAAMASDLDKVKKFIKDGADPNLALSDGDTALKWGAQRGQPAIVLNLLEAGAGESINAVDEHGCPPLYWAVGGVNVVEKYPYAAYTGNKEDFLCVIKMLLDAGADPFMKDKEGKTALDLAQSNAVKAMLQEHMKKIKREAKQAIMEAQPDVPEDVAKLITDITYGERPARSSIVDHRGRTPLYYATYAASDTEIVKALLEKGADVDTPHPSTGSTPLHLVVQAGIPEIAQLYINASKNINAVGLFGSTPLIDASIRGSLEIVKSLIEAAANIHATDKKGKTALIWAARKGYPEVVNELIFAGADPFMKDKKGKTALDLAQSNAIKAMLQEHMKKEAKQAIMEAQPDVPEDVAKLITDITYGERPARSSIEDVD